MPRSRLFRVLLYVILAAIGVGFMLASGELEHTTIEEFALGVIGAGIGLIPPIARQIQRLAAWLESLSARRHAVLLLAISVTLPAYFYIAAVHGQRPLVPLMHDEQMYLLQARQLANGHLVMPALPMGDFFDTFYVFVKPVYASMYFPGTALAYVPAVWMNLPYWVWPAAIMTGLFVMTYLVAAGIVGRFLGLVTIVVMLASPVMAWMPTATMSHPLGGLMGMTILYGWLRWRQSPRLGWAVLIGVATGWMLITRPMESFCFTLPVLAAVILSVRRETLRRTLGQIAVLIACAIPFIMLQLVDDHLITGHWLKLPITAYVEQEFPGVTTLHNTSASVVSNSPLPQKQDMVRAFVGPVARVQAQTPPLKAVRKRLLLMLSTGIGSALLYPLLWLAVPMLRRVEIRVLAASFVLFNLCYVLYAGYNAQYTSQIMPVLSILLVCGVCGLTGLYARHAAQVVSSYTLGIIGVTLVVLVIMPQGATDPKLDWSTVTFNYSRLSKVVQKPALVLFRYGPHSSPFVEPVYNLEAATPDECSIIRAHDLGPRRNAELFRYYAALQPARQVYQFDRDTGVLNSLGTVADLAAKSPPSTAPSLPADAPATTTLSH